MPAMEPWKTDSESTVTHDAIGDPAESNGTPPERFSRLQESLLNNPAFTASVSSGYVRPRLLTDGEVAVPVECGSHSGVLHLSRLCRGSRGQCILTRCGVWFTPNEFQLASGRETAKDWKRSIRHNGKSMKLLLAKGIFAVHPSDCECTVAGETISMVSLRKSSSSDNVMRAITCFILCLTLAVNVSEFCDLAL
ncbi:hypothetical protein J437_LFUL001114 [Ladona fulva]|uniref:SAND domain-containing protein n=1 Tax=Ladona fulva TaxID=123851 RepID=A0A8K0JY20_LADFU|nr:hypothetical protein J437_LFUL001114 [Ladona fulva]